jgi:hypothetical protein
LYRQTNSIDKEKAKANTAPIITQQSNDIQGTKQEDKHQQYAATPTNKTF